MDDSCVKERLTDVSVILTIASEHSFGRGDSRCLLGFFWLKSSLSKLILNFYIVVESLIPPSL